MLLYYCSVPAGMWSTVHETAPFSKGYVVSRRLVGGMEAARRQGGGRRRPLCCKGSLQPPQTAATQLSVTRRCIAELFEHLCKRSDQARLSASFEQAGDC